MAGRGVAWLGEVRHGTAGRGEGNALGVTTPHPTRDREHITSYSTRRNYEVSNYSRGRSSEYRTMRLLEAAGYTCTRAAGSKGMFDVIGVSEAGIVLVQVKLGKATRADRESIRLWRNHPPNAKKLIHVWQARTHEPHVIDCGEEAQ